MWRNEAIFENKEPLEAVKQLDRIKNYTQVIKRVFSTPSCNITRRLGICHSSSIQGLKFRKYRPIFRVSVNTDTIYPLDNRPTEISKFFGSYRRYFADISVFYRFFAIFPDISVLFMEPTLFMNSTISGQLFIIQQKMLPGRFEPCPKLGVSTSHPLGQAFPYYMICKMLIYCLSSL